MSVIQVAITPDQAPGQFRVEVVDSTAGEASAVASLDVRALLARRRELEHAVLLSSIPTRKVFPEEQQVRDVGQVLFGSLLGVGEVAGRYRAAAAVAAERGEGLRVVLRINDPALAGLPWEAMYDIAVGSYVCRRNQMVRHVGVPSAAAPLRVIPPLRILGIVSSPRGLAPLDVDKEKDQLTRALARLDAEGLAEVTWAPSATWADLQDMLLSDEWHVVHFIGHGDFDADHDEGVLALTGEDGRTHLVQAGRLVDLLRQAHPVPRLVVLNSCAGAATGVTDVFSGTAAALVRGGVSAVAAMQYEVTDAAAVAFARGFYGAIARGRGVDEAVSSGRVAIVGLSNRTLEWVTPVLYLRGQDSHLFTVPPPRSTGGVTTKPPNSGLGPTRPEYSRPAASQTRTADPGLIPNRLIKAISARTSKVTCVAFSPDGQLIASTGSDYIVRLWEIPSGVETRALAGHTDWTWCAAFSPEGSVLASAGDDGSVRLWDIATGKQVSLLATETEWVRSIAFSSNGGLFASAARDGTVRLWDTATWTPAWTVAARGSIRAVALSPDGGRLAAGGADHTVHLWDIAARTFLGSLAGHTGWVRSVAFSPDGTTLASASDDKTVRLWDIATGTDIRTLAGHLRAVNCVSFSPDGALVASASDDLRVVVWDVASGTRAGLLQDHTDSVSSVAYSPRGPLASAGNDGTIRLWG